MFGHVWEAAEGTVLDERRKGNAQANGSVNIHFLLEVRPQNGEPFQTEIGMPFSGDFVPPSKGQVVKLEVDVKNQKARWDTSDPAVSAKAMRKADKARFDARLGH
jgi:hypothetical protein